MGMGEFGNLKSTGKWSSPPGTMEEKWFAESLDCARLFGENLGHGQIYAIVKIKVPKSLLTKLEKSGALFSMDRLDGIGSAKSISTNALNENNLQPQTVEIRVPGGCNDKC